MENQNEIINSKKGQTITIKNKKFLVKEIENNNEELIKPQDFIQKEIEFFVKPLFLKYNEYLLGYGVNLSFQDFEIELRNLPGIYSKSKKGTILVILNYEEDENNNINILFPVGMVSLKDLNNNICEMKRLFVLEDFRGFGLGKILMDNIIIIAKNLGYKKFRWDTLKKLNEAAKLYEKYNYKFIDSYNYNPFDDVVYYEIDLNI